HHNPIEPSATTAVWDGDRLTLYDSTQGITATQLTVAALLGLSPSQVRVITHLVGGGFGCKAMIWPHVTLAALAARHIGRPVKLALSREQMFSSCGHREEQQQQVVLGASREGHLTAFRHHKLSLTSPFDDWAEPSLGMSAQLYACPNYEGIYRLIHANTMTPTFTRGPGETTGMFALECAMDELAYELGLDPLELRLRNHADVDPASGNPWSSKGLKECYQRGAEALGTALVAFLQALARPGVAAGGVNVSVVAQPQLQWVKAELVGKFIHGALQREHLGCLARATRKGRRHRVGVDEPVDDLVVRAGVQLGGLAKLPLGS